MSITPQQLIAINLKYGTTAGSLKTLAFSDLSAKALFTASDPQSIDNITKTVAKLIGVASVSNDLIKQGLENLQSEKKARLNNHKWELLPETRKKIEKEAFDLHFASDAVLEKHFPKNINKQKINVWFNDAITDFFADNGDEWVRSVCKGSLYSSKKIKTADELLNSSIHKHNLKRYESELKNAFCGFLTSDDLKDQNYLANVGFAMFSVRLVAANVGADPIALDELRDATLLVDTNFLFALQLESHRLATSLKALGKAMQTSRIKLSYINETKEEYWRVWKGVKDGIIKLFEVYPVKTVSEADDDFISTGLARGCSNKEDFERFFQTIHDFPLQMPGGPKIEMLDNKIIAKEIEKAKKDEELKNSVQKWCSRTRPYWRQLKSPSALEHDASLIYVAELERKSHKKVFILTLDKGLQACSAGTELGSPYS